MKKHKKATQRISRKKAKKIFTEKLNMGRKKAQKEIFIEKLNMGRKKAQKLRSKQLDLAAKKRKTP